MQYLLAHDLGTSGDKAVLYTLDGTVVAQATMNYPTHYPFERAAEQDPKDWWAAFCAATKQLLSSAAIAPGDILALSFSAQMNSCLPVDGNGQALRPAMIWADQRAKEEAKALEDALGLDRLYQLTGQRISASYGIAKMMWLKKHEMEVYKQTARFIQPKDYLILQLTGQLLSDYSDASHLGCLDIHTLSWSEDILRAAGIDKEKLPQLLPSIAPAGKITARAASACGLLAGTLVVTGGGDGPCATAGAGISRPGQTYCSLGTSAWIASLTEKPFLDKDQRTFNLLFLDGRQTMALGASQAAGLSLSWAVDTLYADYADKSSVYQGLDKLIEEVPAGSEGLLFLPYLMGERSPWWNADAKGSFLGLSVRHKREAMLKAVLEGVGLNLALILSALNEHRPVQELTVIGGGARNMAWLQIVSDIWQRPIKVPALLQYATSGGAALCAGIGAGVFRGLDAAAAFNPVQTFLQPDSEKAPVYQQALKRFTDAYHRLYD